MNIPREQLQWVADFVKNNPGSTFNCLLYTAKEDGREKFAWKFSKPDGEVWGFISVDTPPESKPEGS